MPFQWRERSNPAYNRPGKRKFSEAQLLDPHSLTGNGNGSGPLSKRRRGGSPAPFPQPRSPVVHGRNHSNPWQARMPSTLSGRERDKERERERERDASSDLMDGAMSAKSSPILRPTSSHGLGGGRTWPERDLHRQLSPRFTTHTRMAMGVAGMGMAMGMGNGGGGGAGVGIPINIPSHTPASSIGMGMSPGGAYERLHDGCWTGCWIRWKSRLAAYASSTQAAGAGGQQRQGRSRGRSRRRW
jgi:hypothetical protein